MAAGDRSKRIRTNVQRVLKNRGETMEEGLGLAIYEAGDRILRRIAGEVLCLEATHEDQTIAGIETYGLPDDFISERLVRTGGSIEVVKLNRDKFASLKRMLASTTATSDSTASDLFYYYLWGGEIGFLLSSGASPSSAVDFTIDYWRYPTSSEKLTNTRDPVVDPRWDDAIWKGILFDLTADPKWYNIYEQAYQWAKGVEDSRGHEALRFPMAEYD